MTNKGFLSKGTGLQRCVWRCPRVSSAGSRGSSYLYLGRFYVDVEQKGTERGLERQSLVSETKVKHN